jgi:hypothetical protein
MFPMVESRDNGGIRRRKVWLFYIEYIIVVVERHLTISTMKVYPLK